MRNALTSISLAVLVGFSMGIALNLYTPNMVAFGASNPADPNSALKKVTHDATLTGDGTTTVPLGIANGSVTAAKIGAPSPAAGQLLSFNGTGLAWQAPSLGGVRVVDSLGHDVGPLSSNGIQALRRIGAFTFWLSVDQNGFTHNAITFLHTTGDCSGPRYLEAAGTVLVRPSRNNDTQVFFPADPVQELQLRSYEKVLDPGQPGTCDGPYNYGRTFSLGLATSMSLSALGLTPPFHLEF